MGLRLTITDAAYSDYIDIVKYPIEDALTSLHWLGVDGPTSIINHGSGPDANAAGANVTYADHHAVFTGLHGTAANYIQTLDFDNASLAQSLVGIYKVVNPIAGVENRAIWGIWQGGSNGGMALITNAALAYNSSDVVKVANFAGAAAPDAGFVFKATVYDPDTELLTAYRGQSGDLLSSSIIVGSTRKQSTLGARIGGAVSASTYEGTVHIAAVAKHTDVLTSGEVQMIYDYMRLRYAKLGITVE